MKDDGCVHENDTDMALESDSSFSHDDRNFDEISGLDEGVDSVMESAFSIHTPPALESVVPVVGADAATEASVHAMADGDDNAPTDRDLDQFDSVDDSDKVTLDQVDIAQLSASQPDGDAVAIPRSVLGSISVDVRVELGETSINLNELYALQEGQILELDRELGAPLDVVVNNQVVAKCEIVSINYRYAIRIIELVNTQ